MFPGSKEELRKIFREKRASLSDKQRKLKTRDIAKNFYSNISIKPKSIVACYIASGSEVDISLLMEMLEESGHILCLPCVEERNAPMIFREYKRGAPLVKNSTFSFLQPPTNFPEVTPNLIITPLVAFDSAGNRLGMGAGFYDRTFEYLNTFTDFIAVGTAFACQQAPYIKPGTHDYKLDGVATEEKFFVFD